MRALASAESICRHWLPDGKPQGAEWIARNPTRDDLRPGSFSVNRTTGKWADFATDDRGVDLVSLVAYLERTSQPEAARTLAEWLGVAPLQATPAPAPKRAPRPMATRPTSHPKLGSASRSWDYLDAAGNVLCAVQRFETPTGKEFRPLTRTAEGWYWRAPAEPRPLYGLDRLAARPDAPVILGEGEKASDAAGVLLPDCVHIATTSGAKSPAKSDWVPLAGRALRIWPDHDAPGAGFAREAAKLALAGGAVSVEVLDLSSLADALPEGWDAADALAEGWTAERFAERARFHPFREETADQEDEPPDETAQGEPTEGTKLTKPAVNRPCFAVHEKRTGYGPAGTYWHGLKDEKEIDEWICSPLHAEAMTCTERDTDHGLLLRFRNDKGRSREWSAPMALLRGSGEELRGELLSLGVRIDPSSHRLLNHYLMGRYPSARVLAATSTGWHSGGKVFVLPSRTIGTGAVRFQSEHADHDDFTQGGTFDGWKTEVAAPCAGNPILTLAVSAALTGTLLARVHRPGGGIHLVDDSSTGKTTALCCGASCWSGASFIRTWRATGNGLEGAATALNDTALILDEISEADPREVGAIIYAVGNGTGKSRADRSGKARAARRWRVMLLSSGERTLAATMQEGGKRAKAGQEARLLDVPCGRRYGIFDDLHGAASGRAFADGIRTAASRHYGHAGPAFIERLITDPRDYGALLAEILSLPSFEADTSLEGRAAGVFALIALAGELATEWGIVPWPQGEALGAAEIAFRSWKVARGKGQTETRQILEAVGDFIAAHGDSRFSPLRPLDNDGRIVVRDRAGWWKEHASTGERVYLFTSAALREAAAGFDLRRVLDALDSTGWLAERDEGKRSRKTKVQGRALSLYAVRPLEGEL